MSKKLFAVWEKHSPEFGVVGVMAESESDALKEYERKGYKDGTVALCAHQMTLVAPENDPPYEDPSPEELANILKVGYAAIIREADTWLPLAGGVLGLMKMARKQMLNALLGVSQ